MPADDDARSACEELSYADERLLACERLAEELRRSFDADDEPLVVHFRARYARLQREIETWRWYRSSVLSRRASNEN